ncbi:hypothetical protein ACH33_16815 [Aneurinibacillus sp. XH2]|nr:hypothetical protein ACH33_16815 [Aneurinibacillus sp. XH2]
MRYDYWPEKHARPLLPIWFPLPRKLRIEVKYGNGVRNGMDGIGKKCVTLFKTNVLFINKKILNG